MLLFLLAWQMVTLSRAVAIEHFTFKSLSIVRGRIRDRQLRLHWGSAGSASRASTGGGKPIWMHAADDWAWLCAISFLRAKF